MESIDNKNKVGRPKGTIKENKKSKVYDFKLRVDTEEEKLIEQGFEKMELDSKIRGAKKKFIMNLIKSYLLKN